MNNTVFWDVTPCDVVEVYQHFGGRHCNTIFRPEDALLYSQLHLGNTKTFSGDCTNQRFAEICCLHHQGRAHLQNVGL
jgi:hypothetical protein